MSSIKFWVYIIFLKIATNFARGLKSFKIRVDHKLGGKGLDRLCKKLTEFNINQTRTSNKPPEAGSQKKYFTSN